MQGTLYSVNKGIIKKYSGTVYAHTFSIDRASFRSDTKPVYMVDCSAKPGVIYGRTMWFEEDNPENVTRVVEAFKEKYAGQINDYQKRIATLGLYLEGTWKVIL